jgi:hypothetical protein
VILSQGGLAKSSVKASAKTHDGLGAYDISVKGWKKATILTMCEELIRSGECAFPRGGWFGSAMFATHVHVVSNNCYKSLHPEAKAQVVDFKKNPRRDGLYRHGRYHGPDTPLGSWRESPYNPANITEDAGTYYVNVSEGSSLIGNDIDRIPRVRHVRGIQIQAAKQIKRWGRQNVVNPQGEFYALEYLTTTKPEA